MKKSSTTNPNRGRSKLRSIVNSTRLNRKRKGHEKLEDSGEATESHTVCRSFNVDPIMTTEREVTVSRSRHGLETNMMVPFSGPTHFPPLDPRGSTATRWMPFYPDPSPTTNPANASHLVFTLPSPLPSYRSNYHSPYPVQSRYRPFAKNNKIDQAMMQFPHEVVGIPSLRVYRLKLPPHLIHILDEIVLGCEAHAATLPHGWKTQLYSLTQQDIALEDVPHLHHAAKPITLYIKGAMAATMGVESVRLDRNQPHVLKYNVQDGHTGVVLHHDKCDVTANLCLSRSTSYRGGGTFFPEARQVVKLEFGEFLLHPGALVHAGMNITNGTRHLMVMFGNKK